MPGILNVGDKFIIDTNVCEDSDLIEWYSKQTDKVLVAEHIERDVNGVRVKNCPYRIDLDEIIKIK